jgi:hypothetical protein
MISTIPLHRIRLELDQALRRRAFFARALRGDLGESAYGDLVIELSALLSAIDGPLARDLEALATKDLRRLRPVARGACSSCMTPGHFRAVGEAYAERLERIDAHDVSIAIFGSSWTRDAAPRIARRHHGAVRFLRELGRLGPIRFAALRERVESGLVETPHLYSFAEVARGALLGAASYLESIWPAPVVTGEIVIPN